MKQPKSEVGNLRPIPDPASREWWGYGVWGIVALVVAIPELSAVFSHKNLWPTISSTIGHLEYLQDWVGLIVVAVIVSTAVHLAQYPSTLGTSVGRTANPNYTRTPMGRMTTRRDSSMISDRTGGSLAMLFLAAALVAAGSLITVAVDPSDKFILAYVLYGLIAIFFIVIPSVIAFWFAKDVPFPTFFRAVANLESRRHYHFVAVLLMVLLAILLIHLALYPWPGIFHQLKPPAPSSI